MKILTFVNNPLRIPLYNGLLRQFPAEVSFLLGIFYLLIKSIPYIYESIYYDLSSPSKTFSLPGLNL